MVTKKSRKVGRRSLHCVGDDLLCEILIRIPYKSAFACKTVCKRWLLLISDPYFITRSVAFHHLRRQEQQAEDNQPALSLEFLPLYRIKKGPINVVGSCNGLFLCIYGFNFHREFGFASAPSRFASFVCNPFTRQWAAIPGPPRVPACMGFICDPYYEINEQVCINSGCKFKVVAVPRFNAQTGDTTEFHVDVFSSETGKWAEVIASSTEKIVRLSWHTRHRVSVCRKKMFWLTWTRILVYDPYNNKVKCLSGPPPEPDAVLRGSLGVSRDSLWMFQAMGSKIKMWQLEDEKRWSLQGCLDLKVMSMPDWTWRWSTKIKCVDFGVPDVIWLMDITRISLNFRTNTWKTFAREHCNKLFTYAVPIWPTPIPQLPSHISSSSSKI
ncbi:putative F-box protein At3g16210 [Mercurialis annua]|uniref:putative F-box protein At3g16210 n=1 Tax=Mercurialis annua TaxID=3986 RepID=UPI002160ED8F|nr:putative F-box protein At3g16210 [Mercurialis annua]